MNEMPLCVPTPADDNAPVINGYDTSILPLCARLAARVNSFLETEAETPLLRAVQEQTRVALGVISSALDRYRYHLSPPFHNWASILCKQLADRCLHAVA
jgi:FAD synthetase